MRLLTDTHVLLWAVGAPERLSDRDYALEHGLDAPERLGGAVRLVAHLGGYRDRKHDPDPGNQIMWHGQTRLTSAALGHAIGFRAGQRHALRVEK